MRRTYVYWHDQVDNQDGTERRTESYVCSYATKHRGTSVCRRNGVAASQVEDEVMEYTRKIVRNPQFIKDLQEKVMTAVDMTEVENDITAYKKQLSALQRSRDSLEQDIDRIAPEAPICWGSGTRKRALLEG